MSVKHFNSKEKSCVKFFISETETHWGLFSVFFIKLFNFAGQNWPIKLSFFQIDQPFKYIIDGKVDMKLSAKARGLRQKSFEHIFFIFNPALLSAEVPFCYRKGFENIGKLKNLTNYDIHLKKVSVF